MVRPALRVGTVYQNRCDYLDPALPWTGVGDSGKGSSLSTYGYHHLTRRKSIHFRTETLTAANSRYRPRDSEQLPFTPKMRS